MKKGVILIISIIFAIFYVVYASGGPAISWVGGTPDNAEIIYTENISLNITLTEDTNLSTFFDWNNSLVSYWNFEVIIIVEYLIILLTIIFYLFMGV